MSFNWPVRSGAGSPSRLESAREVMIRETNAFLKWALSNPDKVPTIPKRRVDLGGYHYMLQRPGARAAVDHWWYQAIRRL